MNYIANHWSFHPFLILALILAVWHEIGLARLARRSGPRDARRRRMRSLFFYCGLAVMLIAVQSPIEYWSEKYFFVHMVQHLLLMFAAPTLVVAGAPWQPLRAALDGWLPAPGTGPSYWAAISRPVRAAVAVLLRPWVSVAVFSIVMVAWHLPPLLDLEVRNAAVRVWLMQSTFFLAGVLFWLQFIPSPPFQRRMPLVSQAAALVLTNVVMWLLAMAMSIFSTASWYSVYNHLPGITLPPYADQEIGAAILWVCGDFWAIPSLIYILRCLITEDGSVAAAVEQILHRGSASRGTWATGRNPIGSNPPLPPSTEP